MSEQNPFTKLDKCDCPHNRVCHQLRQSGQQTIREWHPEYTIFNCWFYQQIEQMKTEETAE